MSLSAKVGNFAAAASSGNQAVTGVGFQPKAVLLLSSIVSSAGYTAADSVFVMGCLTAGGSWAISADSDNNAANMDTGRSFHTNACFCWVNPAGTEQQKATFVSMDSDGFTINWSAGTSGFTVGYLALGGTDLSSALAGAGPQIPTSGGSVAKTGVGFTPTGIVLAHPGHGVSADSQTASGGVGYASGASAERGIGWCDVDVVTTSSSGTYWNASGLLAAYDDSRTQDGLADLASFDSDGFTLNVTDNPAAVINTGYLAVGDVRVFVGGDTQKTSTGTKATTGVGFTPKAGIFTSQQGTSTGHSGNEIFVVGFSDGTNHFSVGVRSNTGNGTSSTRDYMSTTKAPGFLNNGTTVVAEATVNSWDSDGFTLNYSSADATARLFSFMVFGDAPPSTFIPKVLSF